MADRIIGIYKIENIYNHKVYIGQSKHIVRRCKQHMEDLKKHIHDNKNLQEDFLKYGFKGFAFTVIESCKESELLTALNNQKYHWDIVLLCREYYYMQYYKKDHELYNIEETLKKELLAQKAVKKKFNNSQRNRYKQAEAYIDFIKQYPVLVQNNELTLLEMFVKVYGDTNENKQNYINYGKTYTFSNFYKQAINKGVVLPQQSKIDLKNFLIQSNILYYKNNILQPYDKYITQGYFALDKSKHKDDKLTHYRISITQKGVKFLMNFLIKADFKNLTNK